MNQTVTPQTLERYLHPNLEPANLEAAATTAGFTTPAGGGFRQVDATTPFLSIAGLTTGQFRLRAKLSTIEGGPDRRSPAILVVTPESGNVVSAAVNLSTGEILWVNGLGFAQIGFVPLGSDAAYLAGTAGDIDITVTVDQATNVTLALYHRRALATALDFTTAV